MFVLIHTCFLSVEVNNSAMTRGERIQFRLSASERLCSKAAHGMAAVSPKLTQAMGKRRALRREKVRIGKRMVLDISCLFYTSRCV